MATKYPVRTFEYATIVNVVDGDTCDIELDLGFSVKMKLRFRLAGINAPEIGTPGAKEATDYLKSFLSYGVVVKSTKLDKYGRYLAEIDCNGLNINQSMIDKKLAVPYMV
jgi:endonuclease YncB( thermonuclease family)